jgi:N-acyl-D-amino-acid deacylase
MKQLAIALAIISSISMTAAGQTSPPTNDPAVIKRAIEKSLPLLESIRVPFIEKTGCVSCHHNSLPAMAVGMARSRGFKLNEQTSIEESARILDVLNAGREKLLQGEGMGGGQFTAGYTLLGLAANKQPPNATTDAIVHYLIGRQVADGRWPIATNRPPAESSDITVTALALRGLQLYAAKGLRENVDASVRRARDWLAKAAARNNEEQTFQLLGLAWANADRRTIQKMAAALLARQRKDGGWSQHPVMESDAYATGQALTALHQAGVLPVAHPAYQRGIRYLLNDQAAEGSWLVLTRSLPIQKYFESGFPYGDNQWISAAATSWATMALLLTVEPPTN